MTWPDSTIWDRNDRLPVPFDDPAREWTDDMVLTSPHVYQVPEPDEIDREAA